MTETLPKAAGRARLIVLVLGVVYLALAVIGLAVLGWGSIRESENARLLGVFGLSRLLIVAHGALGVIAVLAALRRGASAFAAVATIVFVAMTAFGVVANVVGDVGDPLHMTWWNVGLYALSAVTCVYVYALRMRAEG
ncbi:DUF4383 domain-containing protein [Actinophytocola sp. NPDC049390]|uniref:DUF4383 domain-containing protein n=1 Tax=Actinophytocola sp. NPDC049390 TaxID=3363894 RepID=UPI0037A79031